MNAFMLYMSGSSLQIFSIGILAMLLLNPFKAIAGINTGAPPSRCRIGSILTSFFGVAFAPFAPASSNPTSSSTLLLQKLVFVVCNVLTLCLGLWKCRQLGLLPTGSGDWLAFETRGPVSRDRFLVTAAYTYP